ncbi:MAG: DegT/DnrJ/EryC1/StrS family aminotransferase [Planctomycetota bacterium]|jgi:dTDP-4-amino-4,6-dideoxygalactose transaminase
MSTAYEVVRRFESEMAQYTGAPYAVAVESCSAALFLCCIYLKVKQVEIPKTTYPSVACGIVNAGGTCKFRDENWQPHGHYALKPYPIIDSAKYIARDMYQKGQYVCLSFHLKKHIPIGRGGMILTDNKIAVNWLKAARFDGRHECPLWEDTLAMAGWNMYMTPEQAARGLELMQWFGDGFVGERDRYHDLSKYDFYKQRLK